MSFKVLSSDDIRCILGDGLLAAVCSRDFCRVESLLQAEDLCTGEIDNIPLGLACLNNDVDIVKTFIKHGVKANVKADLMREYNLHLVTNENRKWTALQFACSKKGDREELVNYLIQAGGDVNAPRPRNRWGKTPLQLAVQAENIPIVKLLINAGADVNCDFCENNEFKTPLSQATTLKNEELIWLLLDAGADTQFKFDSCLEISIENHFLKGVEIFSRTPHAERDMNDLYGYTTRLCTMRDRSNLCFEEDLLDFMSEGVFSIPLVHYICSQPNEDPWDMLQVIPNCGLDIHRKDWRGFNCLQHVCSRLHIKTLHFLLCHGVTPETDGWDKLWKFFPPVNCDTIQNYLPFLKLLRFSGFNIDGESVSKLEESMNFSDVDEVKLRDMRIFLNTCNSPLSLKCISRIRVRHCLSTNIDTNVVKLSEFVPTFLIEYLQFHILDQ